jgi:iron-sulfur cluster assembly protein
MITVSDKAKERILELKKEEGRMEQENIRVSVKGGGCSGLMYELGFDAQMVDTDHVSDGLNGKGFQFVNPNASRTCGCGESFSV